jgi:hypothetical protein
MARSFVGRNRWLTGLSAILGIKCNRFSEASVPPHERSDECDCPRREPEIDLP